MIPWMSEQQELRQGYKGLLIHVLWGWVIVLSVAVLGWDWRLAAVGTFLLGIVWEWLGEICAGWEPSILGALTFPLGGLVGCVLILLG